MANLCALTTTSNFSGNWGTADTTSASIAGTTSTAVTTGNLDSAVFTPGIITIDGVYLNLALRTASPTGTFSVTLRNSTAGSNVVTTTVNVADLPAIGATAQSPGAWIFIYWGSQTLSAATNYLVRVTSSSASQLNLYAGAANDWNRLLRIPGTTATIAASDRLFISKELTGAGTSNAVTLTMDNNSTTSFGQQDYTGVTVNWNTGGNTRLRQAGNCYIWEGTVNIGTSGTPVPVGTTALWEPDCGSNVQYGIEVKGVGVLNMYGGDKTYWKSLLAADAAGGATSLTLTDSVDVNWKNGDSIALASTTRTVNQSEKKALSADGSGTTLTIAAITNAHSGTSPTQGEVVNLTRNVKIAPSGAFSTYLRVDPVATVNLSWAEFTLLGSATANKRGIDVLTTTGTFTMDKCSVHDCTVASSLGANITGTSGNSGVSIQNTVFYNIAGNFVVVAATTGTPVLNGVIGILNSSGSGFLLNDAGTTLTNPTAVSSASNGYAWGEAVATLGIVSGLVAHSNTSAGLAFIPPAGGTISTITSWRNGTAGIDFSGGTNSNKTLVVDTATLFGNTTANINFSTVSSMDNIILKSITSNAGATLTCPIGVRYEVAGNYPIHSIENSTFGATTAHATGDISFTVAYITPRLYLYNCLLNSAIEVATPTNISNYGFIRSSMHDQVAGAYKSWLDNGTVESDAVTFNTAAPSEKLTPTSTTTKLKSAIKTVALNSGQTATVAVWINKSAAYNGAQPRLMVGRNASAGIAADTVLATYSAGTGSWNQISGTTAAVSENCALEFWVDCDKGTGGFINVDDYSVTLS